MNRISIVIIMSILLMSVLALSETVIFADDFCSQKMPKYTGNRLSISNECVEMTPCDYPIASDEADETAQNVTMKDSSYTLAFIDTNETYELTLEEYLIGVVMSELPYTFEIEAVKAQAVAARTYAIRELESGNRHAEGRLCSNPSHCSAYITRSQYESRYGNEAYKIAYEKVKEAVNQTDGQIITYNGEPCCAVYHSASDGYTENSYNLWGTETPYLKSVYSAESTPLSTVKVKESEMMRVLSSYGTVNGSPDDITLSYNDSGRCQVMKVDGVSIKGKTVRSLFGLKSCDFSLSYADGIYTFSVRGYGHGIGLSQHGANEMAKAGKTYEEILLHYYSGVELSNIEKPTHKCASVI